MLTSSITRRSRFQQVEKLTISISLIAIFGCLGFLFQVSALFFSSSLPDPDVSLTRRHAARLQKYESFWGSEDEPEFANLKLQLEDEFTDTEDTTLEDSQQLKHGMSDSVSQFRQKDEELVSRVAFGSCTSRRAISQPIWRRGIIPSAPQAWIWAGDIAYMDWPDADCKENPDHIQCNCTRNWLHVNRQTCLAGDVRRARERLNLQLQNPDYKEFVRYMCPDMSFESQDKAKCSRPILGTWDDHDYNWQDGDKRLLSKEEQKQLFLDAFGVPLQSPRRIKDRGIHWKHTLNEGVQGKEIDVILLDERFHRDSKPCETRRKFCELVALPDPKKYKHEWCKDFLFGGKDGIGSCCRKDEQIWAGWCKINRKPGDELWEAACNPASKMYGFPGLEINASSGAPFWSGLTSVSKNGEGVLCEVLGVEQRAWLQDELYKSKALLKLIVSGSPAFNNPQDFVCAKALKWRPAVNCSCFDDYDCYRPAQMNLLHMMAHAPGCVVVLTGDFHFSDIKVLQPGEQSYSDAYGSFDLPRPIYQVMASGLTSDTAQMAACDGYRVDRSGFRPGGECAFVSEPAFGMIEIDWDAPEKLAKLQVRDESGEVKIESILRLDTCSPA
ncbi:hypothetical protein R1sor_024924 [Riccia sorocarpa]|uniref:PhoD-like phosphatase metallophosphatase domain-containing protein n=1 Tax=Riccia sorocarpa TaxID=122646 RepID=A0ABD3GSN1_9MARC